MNVVWLLSGSDIVLTNKVNVVGLLSGSDIVLTNKVNVVGLLSGSDISENCYDWLKVLKYHMEIRTILRAKTESMESEIDSTQAPRQTSFGKLDHEYYVIMLF